MFFSVINLCLGWLFKGHVDNWVGLKLPRGLTYETRVNSKGLTLWAMNQSVQYGHCCLFFVILIKMSAKILAGSQWFLIILPNQAWYGSLAAQGWFGRRFRNHRLCLLICLELRGLKLDHCSVSHVITLENAIVIKMNSNILSGLTQTLTLHVWSMLVFTEDSRTTDSLDGRSGRRALTGPGII